MKRFILLFVAFAPFAAAESPALNLADGDRVVFVGATLVERDQTYGYFETYLNLQFPRVNFIFRNLGWSGDNVWGDARAAFGTRADGYKKLVGDATDARPTVLLINYGMSESFDGEAGLPKFIEQYSVLLDDLSRTGAKIWLISPNRHEDLGRPLPDPKAHNEQLKLYTAAIAKLAEKRGCGFVNLFEMLPDGAQEQPPRALTDNGIHFAAYGSARLGAALLGGLVGHAAQTPPRGGLTVEKYDELRQTIIEKNREYFYRWRPQNETYIFGFRKKEQGRNAVEIPQFDTIVEKLEAKIAELKKPAN